MFANETIWIGGNRSSVQPFMIIIGAGLPRPFIHSGDRYCRTCRQIGSTSDAVYGSPSLNVSSQSGRAAPRSCSADANCPVAVPSRYSSSMKLSRSTPVGSSAVVRSSRTVSSCRPLLSAAGTKSDHAAVATAAFTSIGTPFGLRMGTTLPLGRTILSRSTACSSVCPAPYDSPVTANPGCANPSSTSRPTRYCASRISYRLSAKCR